MFFVKNKQNEERLYSSVSNARWKINNRDVVSNRDLNSTRRSSEDTWREILRKESDIS